MGRCLGSYCRYVLSYITLMVYAQYGFPYTVSLPDSCGYIMAKILNYSESLIFTKYQTQKENCLVALLLKEKNKVLIFFCCRFVCKLEFNFILLLYL